MKKYIFILIAITFILSVVFLIYKKKKEKLYAEKFKDYRFLSEGSVESENYEIVKVFDSWMGRAEVDGIIDLDYILYDTKYKNIIFHTNLKGYQLVNGEIEFRSPSTLLWKLDANGKLLDSIKTDYNITLHDSGVLIDKNEHYINWINGGDKIKRKYDANFSLVEDAKRFEKFKNAYSETLTSKSTEKAYSLETEYFKKIRKQSTSLGDFNSNGRSGWNGMGYFKLNHNSDSIKFKGHAFNGKLDRYKIYYPVDKNIDIAILYLRKRASDARPFENSGIYVVRKKIKTPYR